MHSERETFITYLPVSDTVMHCLITWIVWHCCSAHSLLCQNAAAACSRWYSVLVGVFYSVCTFLLTTTFFFHFVFASMLFLYRIFAQCHIFSCERIFLRLLSRSVYLFIPHTHISIFVSSVFSRKKNAKVVFLRLSHTTFFVVGFFSLLLHQT